MSTVGHESIPRPADAEIITRLRKVVADLDGIIAVAPPEYRERITWIAVTAESVIARIGEAGEPGELARAVLCRVAREHPGEPALARWCGHLPAPGRSRRYDGPEPALGRVA